MQIQGKATQTQMSATKHLSNTQPPLPLKPESRVGGRNTHNLREGRGIFRLRAWDTGCTVGRGLFDTYGVQLCRSFGEAVPYCNRSTSSSHSYVYELGMCVSIRHMWVSELKKTCLCFMSELLKEEWLPYKILDTSYYKTFKYCNCLELEQIF